MNRIDDCGGHTYSMLTGLGKKEWWKVAIGEDLHHHSVLHSRAANESTKAHELGVSGERGRYRMKDTQRVILC